MTAHYDDGRTSVYLGDCIEVMREMPANSVDAIVTDPPYGLGFMGKAWDALPPGLLWAEECIRVLKPGGHLLAFGGTRTWHRLAVAVEDAGFEMRDSIAWLYGSGFPKSMDVSKAIDKAAGAKRPTYERGAFGASFSDDGGTTYGTAIDGTPITPDAEKWQGWGTALKPAFEPIVVARKPLELKTVAANVLAHGTGALNIDATRVGTAGATKRGSQAEYPKNADGSEDRSKSWARTGHEILEINLGRWPANVMLDEAMADVLDGQSGVTKSSGGSGAKSGRMGTNVYGANLDGSNVGQNAGGLGDVGGASRFFYVAKAPASERPKTDDGTAHPTVKPLTLMRQLVRLVTPPGGVVLDPFTGSGTTVEAAILDGFRVIGIERERDYWPLIRHRIARGEGVL